MKATTTKAPASASDATTTVKGKSPVSGSASEIAKEIQGSMKSSYPNMDASAAQEFIAKPEVVTAYQKTIAESYGLSKDSVTVALSVSTSRRLSAEARRLAATIIADYTVTVPSEKSVPTVPSVAPADLQTKLKAKLTDAGIDQATIDSVSVTEALTAAPIVKTASTTQAPGGATQAPGLNAASVASRVRTSVAEIVAMATFAHLLIQI